LTPAIVTIVSAAALAAAGIAAAAHPRAAATADPPRAVLDALGPQAYTPQTAREGAVIRSADIPLPTGGNFNGIRWEEMVGEIPAGTVDTLLQHNAACQWLRAWRRGSGTALEQFRRAATWPALRSAPIATVADQASRGGGRDLAAMLSQCNASHTRQVSYARRLGLTPST
jgi:hypothetical protein